MTSLKFCFKGSREYVQGPDIVAALFDAMSKRQLSQMDLKFNGITKTNMDLVEGNHLKNAQVNIRWQESGEQKKYQLVENGEKINCRYEFHEKEILDKTILNQQNKKIQLQAITGYSVYENIVAMNKFLLQSIFPEEQGKWYFTRLEQARLIADKSLIEVKLIKNFNFRLTKSDIAIDGEVVGSVYFTMVRGEG